MVGLLGRGNALHGREATRSLLRYLCAAITEHVRVTVEQSLPGNLSIEDWGNTQTGALRYAENHV